jgi:hypothetical protein
MAHNEGRTQQIISELLRLMNANAKFGLIRRYLTSAKAADIDEFPVCVIVVDEDEVTRLGHKNHHRLTLLVSFTFLEHTLEGNRYSYQLADALEDLLNDNMKIELQTGEFVGFQLVKKTYELNLEETQVVDGVVCEIECKYIGE